MLDLAMPIHAVDDFQTMVRIVRNLLEQIATISTKHRTARAPWPSSSFKQYGLVISDWNMEPMSGFELVQLVRANPAFDNMRFIMVTAESKPKASSRPSAPGWTTISSNRSTRRF